jgi:hypothetical protein
MTDIQKEATVDLSEAQIEQAAEAAWDIWNMTGPDSTRWDELEDGERLRWIAAAAPYLQAQPEPVDGKLVAKMLDSYMDDDMAAALRVAVDALLREPTMDEVNLMRGGYVCSLGSLTDCLKEFCHNRRSRLTAKKTPEERGHDQAG